MGIDFHLAVTTRRTIMYHLCLFDYERLEDSPHQVMFGTGPEIAMFENIAPYVSCG